MFWISSFQAVKIYLCASNLAHKRNKSFLSKKWNPYVFVDFRLPYWCTSHSMLVHKHGASLQSSTKLYETFGKKLTNGAPHRPDLRLEYVIVYLWVFLNISFSSLFSLAWRVSNQIVHCVTVKTLSTVTSAEKRKWVSSPFFLYHLLEIRYFCYLIKCFEITLWYNERTRLSDERVENDSRRKDSVIKILLTMILQSQSKIERS